MKLKGRIDSNQNEIVTHLRKIPGVSVYSTANLGCGFPDIIVGYQGLNYLFEIKDPSKPPSKRKLTVDEEEFHLKWNGHVEVIETVEEIIEILRKDEV